MKRSPGRPRSPVTEIVRGAIIEALKQGAASVSDIETRMGVVPSTSTNYHLRVMERAGLIVRSGARKRPDGKRGTPHTLWSLKTAERAL